MERASQDEARNEERLDQHQNSSASVLTNQVVHPAHSRKSNLTREIESLGTQSLEIPRGLDATELHMTRQKARRLQGISGKPSTFDAEGTGHYFLKPVSPYKSPKSADH